MDRGETPSRRLEFHPYACCSAIRRPIGGDHYKRIEDACRRLKSAYVETNVGSGQTRDGDVEKGGFSWMDALGSGRRRTARSSP